MRDMGERYLVLSVVSVEKTPGPRVAAEPVETTELREVRVRLPTAKRAESTPGKEAKMEEREPQQIINRRKRKKPGVVGTDTAAAAKGRSA